MRLFHQLQQYSHPDLNLQICVSEKKKRAEKSYFYWGHPIPQTLCGSCVMRFLGRTADVHYRSAGDLNRCLVLSFH